MAAEKAQRIALTVSVFVIVPIAIIGFMKFRMLFFAILGLFIVMDNLNSLQSGQPLINRPGSRPAKASGFHQELIQEAEAALKDEDWREAARLCHHMRSVGAMPDPMLARVWTILGLANMEMGNYGEALEYLERAPDTKEVRAAFKRCKEGRAGS